MVNKMKRQRTKKQEQIITVRISTVPHPNPQRAIDLIANLVLKNYSDELERACDAKSINKS